MTNNKVLRRNLSGIYIFDTLEGERRRKPTCIEDCNDETRCEWIRSLEPKARINTANVLCDALVDVVDFAHAEGMIESESREMLCREAENCRVIAALDNLLKLCDLLRLLGDKFGLVRGEKGGEE